MILVFLAGLCLASVPLTGGDLRRLGDLRFRLAWLAPVALYLQVLVITIAPGGQRSLHVAIHVASYALLAIVLCANLRLPGMKLIGIGAAANILAIVLNGGVMPAAATAVRIAHLTTHGGFQNSTPVAHPTLLWLGDVIPVPGPLPNTLSVGDCLILIGALVLLHKTCGRRSRASATAAAAAVGPVAQ
ncbi:MAG TPA: DUF5317 domain-containing protein [Solirubrobacteraceae bacterium]|nr:DUF5317 domain-containing protein [Solirubrobacteraceae bacterium]